MNVKNQTEFVDQLKRWNVAGVQAVHVIAGGQAALAETLIARAFSQTQKFSKDEERNVVSWDCVRGLVNAESGRAINNTIGLTEAVLQIATSPSKLDATAASVFGKDTCVILRDPHFFLKQMPACLSALKEAIKRERFGLRRTPEDGPHRRVVYLITNGPTLTDELSGYVKTIDLPLPVKAEIEAIVDNLIAGWPDDLKSPYAAGTPGRDAVCRASVGLGVSDIRDTVSVAVSQYKGDLDRVRGVIERQKADILKKSEVLTYEPLEQVVTAPELKGYENLDDWVEARKVVYTVRAEELGLDMPKGIGLVGIPGGGKSVAARSVARRLGLPLVWFDVSAVFGSLVGESERRMREAIAAVEAIESCVLVVDEIDKAMGNAHESVGDSGVTQRVLGNLLSWMAGKTSKVFVMFTMNRIDKLPPELTRRGRLDEIFVVDLPDAATRREILEVHMRRRRVDPAGYTAEEWERMTAATDGFVGAELEEVVKASRLEALTADPAGQAVPTAAQLQAVIGRLSPLSKSSAEDVDRIRKFAAERAVPVGRTRPVTPKKSKGGGRTIIVREDNGPQYN